MVPRRAVPGERGGGAPVGRHRQGAGAARHAAAQPEGRAHAEARAAEPGLPHRAPGGGDAPHVHRGGRARGAPQARRSEPPARRRRAGHAGVASGARGGVPPGGGSEGG